MKKRSDSEKPDLWNILKEDNVQKWPQLEKEVRVITRLLLQERELKLAETHCINKHIHHSESALKRI